MASVCCSRAWRGGCRGSECGVGSCSEVRDEESEWRDSSNMLIEE